MNTQKNSPTYLLLKDYFRRYRIILALFAVAQISICAALFVQPGSQLALILLISVFFYLSFASACGYLLTMFFVALAVRDLSLKWPRAALALPVSRNSAATCLWVEFVVVPTLLTTASMFLMVLCDRSGLLSQTESLTAILPGNTGEGLTHALTRYLVCSLCFSATICLLLESWDVIGRHDAMRVYSRSRLLSGALKFLLTFLAAGVYLLWIASVFESWMLFTITEYLATATMLIIVAASYSLRRSLLSYTETFRRIGTPAKPSKPVRAPAAKRRSKHPFMRSYARLAGLIGLFSLVSYGVGFIYVRFLQDSEAARFIRDIVGAVEEALPLTLLLFSIGLSLSSTPPLRECRCLPLRPHQLLLHFVAYPATVFLSMIAFTLPLLFLQSRVQVPQAVAIEFIAFGTSVLILGLLSCATKFLLRAAIYLALVISLSVYSFDLDPPVNPALHGVPVLSMIACVLFTIGLVMWFRGITRSSLAYNAMTRRDLGKIVF